MFLSANFFSDVFHSIHVYNLDVYLKEEYLETVIYFLNNKVIHLDLRACRKDQRIGWVKGWHPCGFVFHKNSKISHQDGINFVYYFQIVPTECLNVTERKNSWIVIF